MLREAAGVLAAYGAVASLRVEPLLCAALLVAAVQGLVRDRTARAVLLLSVPMALDSPVDLRTDYKGYSDAFFRPLVPAICAAAAVAQAAAPPRADSPTGRALALVVRVAAAVAVAPLAPIAAWLVYMAVARLARAGCSRRSVRLLGQAVRFGIGAPVIPAPAKPCFYAVNYPRTLLEYAAVGLFEGDVSILAAESSGWRSVDCPIVFQPQGCKYTELREIFRAELERGRSVISFAEFPWGSGAVRIRRSTLFAAQDLGVQVVPVYVDWPAYSPFGMGRVRVETGAPFAVYDTDQQARHVNRFWWRAAYRFARDKHATNC